jgi:hypothetical protein
MKSTAIIQSILLLPLMLTAAEASEKISQRHYGIISGSMRVYEPIDSDVDLEPIMPLEDSEWQSGISYNEWAWMNANEHDTRRLQEAVIFGLESRLARLLSAERLPPFASQLRGDWIAKAVKRQYSDVPADIAPIA